jgi:hypothetical protein
MNKHLSLSTYRLIDISIFTVLMVVFELIAVKAINWFDEVYSVSLFLTIALILIMRWGFWSIFTIITGAIIYCYAIGATVDNYLVYIGGNLFILFNLFWFTLGKERIQKGALTLLYVLSGFVLVELGRSLIASFLGFPFFPTLIGFLGSDVLSALLALLIIMITRKQNGLFEDQIAYLIRVNQEEEPKEAN